MAERSNHVDMALLVSVCSGLGKTVVDPSSGRKVYIKDDDCLGTCGSHDQTQRTRLIQRKMLGADGRTPGELLTQNLEVLLSTAR